MANQLDELNPVIREEGLDVNVIAKQIQVKVGVGSRIFEIFLWILFIIPGLIFLFMKVKARSYFLQLEQKIQHNASQIDNYLEQRVVVLQNCAALVDKAANLDKETFENISKYRSGYQSSGEGADAERNAIATNAENLAKSINIAFEKYPELKAHEAIADAMQQNMYLQREITAARELYNDTVNVWNRDVFAWPTKMIVAARQGYTTRIPFIASKEMKEKARGVFF